ncbi:1-phosphatidylinositol 4,5-bisphosphate phosphodiesterase delta-3-A-like [Entelurus aequoreus]|uniref:1-phosphatidylinositol 4,5-bisphosphate phosphodiesterase delta-3-A-like n=1 Tax=Entelurus aequoreus TaxID=161455 RepID=UPI002B1D137C|nr:1-phosphatidylinositol 4,5-bisphosphate phosphodiesterase delta-3-A-like [Entelurus aequoreus]
MMLASKTTSVPLRSKRKNKTPDAKVIDLLGNLGVQDDEDVKWMLQGSSMVKVRSGRWQKPRTLKLLDDGVTIWCESFKIFRRAREQQSFSISEVECVREGCHSETLQRMLRAIPENRCLTVVFKGPRRNLDLLCQNQKEALHWAQGIRTLKERSENMSQKEKLDHWILGYLSQADVNHDDKMSYDEVQSLLQMINIDLSEQYARELFEKCDRSADNRLDHGEIEIFCKELLRRPELDAVFRRYSANRCVLSTADLRDFLKDQGEDASKTHAQSLIHTYELNEWAQKNQFMTPNGFTMYMLSKENSVFEAEHAWVYQNMNQPLSHYFISSSHNTYLSGDQLTGESDVEPYIRALNNGCRCVELDCWDGDKGQPIIYHGYTLTSKVSFAEVIKTINEYAFKASPYPLILSLENHCSVEQQTVMAQHMRAILGDKLLTKPISDLDYNTLPSPENLKGKILVKGKKEKTVGECSSSSSEDSSSDETSEAESNIRKKKDGKKSETTNVCRDLSDLVVYTQSVHFKNFQHAASTPASHMSSFSENQALKHVSNSGMNFVRHNIRHLTRTYPSGQRLQSSNYNPQSMWNGGCQFVALNFQTSGEPMDLNQGKFLQNGKCGYILKPPYMCRMNTTFNPGNVGGGPGHAPVLLTIKIISAQQLPKHHLNKPAAIVDPQVCVEIHGVPIDNDKKKTHHIQNNGFNPQWDATLNFTIHAPDLALVRFVVEDHDYTSYNDFLGQYTLPFTSLRTGYRHVQLLKQDGSNLSPSSLFIHVKMHGTSTS